MSNNSFSHIIKTINQICFDGTNFNLKKTDLDEVPHTTNNYIYTANMVSEKSTQTLSFSGGGSFLFFYILPFDNSSHLYYNVNRWINQEGEIIEEAKGGSNETLHYMLCAIRFNWRSHME